jgi:hypothetical protein
MLRKILPSAILLAGTITTYSQEVKEEPKAETPKPTISGSVDAYYRFNLSNPKDAFNNYTSFTNSQNSFELGMASVKLEHSFGKVGLVADVGFGKRAEEFSYNDENTRLALKQAYITFAPTDHFKFTAGSWATHVGYEVLDPYGNRNYSMTYMFSFGPFSHTGLKGEYSFGSSGIMLGISNPCDTRSADFSHKTFLAQYSYVTDPFKLYLNFMAGKQTDSSKVEQLDLVTSTSLSDKFSIGFNGTMAMSKYRFNGKFGDFSKWWGTALYLNFDPIQSLGFTLRGEYFNDEKAVSAAAFSTDIFETTLSANIKVNGLTIIPELRYDRAGSAIFTDATGSPIRNTTTALIAAVYKF